MKNIEIGEVYTIKLSSGEEIISKIINIFEDTIVVSSPVSVAPGPQGVGLIPSLFTSDPNTAVVLNSNCITMWSETDSNVKNKYIEAVSGIKLPSKKIVLG